MDTRDFNKISTQQDLSDYLSELEFAIHAIIMNDAVDSHSALYCTLRLCEDSIFYAKSACGDFNVELNSFKDE